MPIITSVYSPKQVNSVMLNLLIPVSRLLPWEANVATYRFMGGDRCMMPFIKNMEIKAAKDQVKTS
jgi:hypothetical protein